MKINLTKIGNALSKFMDWLSDLSLIELIILLNVAALIFGISL